MEISLGNERLGTWQVSNGPEFSAPKILVQSGQSVARTVRTIEMPGMRHRFFPLK
jgi:hypothetical protein